LVNCSPGVLKVNGVIPIKHLSCRMACYPHNNRFGDPGFSHVSVERVPQIVKYEAVLYKSAIVYLTRVGDPMFTGLSFIPRGMSDLRKDDPYLLYTFEFEKEALLALLDLPFMHIAEDSQNLICTEVLDFGY